MVFAIINDQTNFEVWDKRIDLDRLKRFITQSFLNGTVVRVFQSPTKENFFLVTIQYPRSLSLQVSQFHKVNSIQITKKYTHITYKVKRQFFKKH